MHPFRSFSHSDEYVEKKHIWEETKPALTGWFAKSKL